MATPDRFDEYVMSGAHRLLPHAERLTGDPALAEELVREALARARRGWRQFEVDPEPPIRAIMEATYSERWRARTPDSGPDRLGAVRERIGRARARRRRIAAGAVVVPLLIMAYVAMPGGRTSTPRVAPSTSPLLSDGVEPARPMPSPIAFIDGFKEYAWGARVVATKTMTSPTGRSPSRSHRPQPTLISQTPGFLHVTILLIGYTDPWHLAPVAAATVALVAGLALTWPVRRHTVSVPVRS